MKTIAIGGFIASGKSTLAKMLAEKLDVPWLKEFEEGDPLFEFLLNALYNKETKDKMEKIYGQNSNITERLLQDYFLNAYATRQMKLQKEHPEVKAIITDNSVIGHGVFAQTNITNSNFKKLYEGTKAQYLLEVGYPSFYIILESTFDTFKRRLFERGRKAEVDNWDNNYSYFQTLHATFTKRLRGLCDYLNIPYLQLPVDSISPTEVLNEVMKRCEF